MQADQFKHTDDQQLLRYYYNDRNNQWIGVLLQRYTLMLLGVCMKYLKDEEDAREAVQQVYLKVLQELPKYQVDYFKSWLYMVAKNHCLVCLRERGKLTHGISEQLAETAPDPITSRNEHLQKDRTLQQMAAALEQLNKEQQQCVTLFYLQKKSYQEITTLTGYSLMQVKSYIQNGKRNLKILLERMPSHES